ncbi:MAG: CRISPR system precrRNA processing endoribonuclease RAMP protein Cas6 [Nitrospira sp. SB0677_bin_15]|nr:CRISPR system precrRNA processing endoribonuclease RAMP protein Cas6 [Nitrospira sp. SB0667_bin_9]MYD31098.1 CRISPR system precrRNA processing endoribonuclease RAMP protein Cas6 [Nitrospira sp. SB0661_bin_20]MYG40598.1 CRISPR system precrRNA processing endoribonuclease RAMP protein Cas6 [Nitrospira sp. SB0677_bin_15]MYH02223.1 CRISPR system precrRNA processing endoribonuclease RAMP protein Cas6 [Nitrospira sp. SB0675_bin_23]MYJ23122.1 CRISPR system precrRNA processing endoribonuclease RAMP p
MIPIHPQPCLPLAQYRFKFRTTDDIRLPGYSGSAWRGAFGHSLKKLVCVTREPQCESCLLYRHCRYPYFFETPPDPAVGKLRKYNAVPHPFVLSPGSTLHGQLAADTEHMLDVTLFGHGNQHLPYIIHALDKAAQQGIGKQRGALELLEVQQQVDDDWDVIYRPGGQLNSHQVESINLPDCPTQFKIRLLTPLRMKVHGRLVTPDAFTFKVLFSTLLRRISLLTAFHSDTPLETDFAGLSRMAEAIPITSHELRWHEWTRYSSRQGSLMQLGGLLGTAAFESSTLAHFWPYIWLGQWTHAGKNTSMGLGKYQIIGVD